MSAKNTITSSWSPPAPPWSIPIRGCSDGSIFIPDPIRPSWWTKIAPPILGPSFTLSAVAAFLRRRGRAPIKAVLLMQERFPGVGNWMADEILWRAAIYPGRPAGSLSEKEIAVLRRECRRVCRQALAAMIGREALPVGSQCQYPRHLAFPPPLGRRRPLPQDGRSPPAGRHRGPHDLLVPGPAVPMSKLRLDELLVARGLAATRAQAKALIMAGEVFRGTERLAKPGREFSDDAEITLAQRPRFVSRGGEKLAAALGPFALDLRGAHILDVGASTGGFTDCALQAGAASSVCVDVGRAQLHARLRADPRVTNLEKINARNLETAELPRRGI